MIRIERLAVAANVGYGDRYRAPAGKTIGTLPVGYADGYMPARDGAVNVVQVGEVLVPVVSLAMDMAMVDLDPYIERYGRPPQVVSTPVILISSAPPPAPTSVEAVAERWGLQWPVALSGIRTRNTRVYR